MSAMPVTSAWMWIGFFGFVAGMMALDLGVFHKKAHVVTLKEAGIWSAVWVALSLGFDLIVWANKGRTAGLEFLTGYVIEESLSLDNLFVFLVIFRYFRLPEKHYHRVLIWGIIGAIVLRGLMISLGVELVNRFEWTIPVFGAILLFTAVRLVHAGEERIEPGKNWLFRITRLFFEVEPRFHDGAFFIARRGRWAMTPLFVALLVVSSADVVFATDSIPAIFAVTRDPFIVFTSNMFAVMGLRSMFFLLSGILDRFRYLKVGLALVLGFIGIKMMLEPWVHIPIGLSLAVVALTLAGSIGLSLRVDRNTGTVTRRRVETPRG